MEIKSCWSNSRDSNRGPKWRKSMDERSINSGRDQEKEKVFTSEETEDTQGLADQRQLGRGSEEPRINDTNETKRWTKRIVELITKNVVAAIISGIATLVFVLFSPIRDSLYFWAYDVWPTPVPVKVKLTKGNGKQGYFDFNNVTVKILDQDKQPAKKTDGEGIARFKQVYTGFRRFSLSQESSGGWSTIKERTVHPSRSELEIKYTIKTFNIEGQLWIPSQENSKFIADSNKTPDMLAGLTVLIKENKELTTKVHRTGKFSFKDVPAFQINPDGKLTLVLIHSDCPGPIIEWSNRSA